jgi:hypothetical protein
MGLIEPREIHRIAGEGETGRGEERREAQGSSSSATHLVLCTDARLTGSDPTQNDVTHITAWIDEARARYVDAPEGQLRLITGHLEEPFEDVREKERVRSRETQRSRPLNVTM